MKNRATRRLQNDASSNGKPLDYGEMFDGSLSGPEGPEKLKSARNVFGFGKAVSLSNTSVHAVMVGVS